MATTQKAKEQTEESFFIFRQVKKMTDSGYEMINEINEKYVTKLVDTSKDLFEERYEQAKPMVDKMLEKGRTIQKDSLKKFNEIVDNGRKVVDKYPMVESLEKKITNGVKTAMNKMNLPSKADLEKLMESMNILNKKMETITKKKKVATKESTKTEDKGEESEILFRKFS